MVDGPRSPIVRLGVYLGAVILGVSLGGVTALAMGGLLPATQGLQSSGIDVEGWHSDFTIGSQSADPYTRARVARTGLLALAHTEAVYFLTDTDEQGRPLTENCDYRIFGAALPAHWWSITLYDSNNRLPMNSDNALSIDAHRVDDESWNAMISSKQPDGGLWLSSRNAGRFDLMLRLYVPDPRLFSMPHAVLNPPRVLRLNCKGGGI